MKIKQHKLKVLSLSIILILLSICLCGCASVNLVTYHDSNGMIYEYVYINIDEQILSSHGYDIENVKLEIKTNAYTEASKLLNEYHNTLAMEYQRENISSEEYTLLYNGVKPAQEDWKNNTYSIGFKFNNSTIYKKYHELMNGLTFKNNSKQIKKLFYTKTYYYGTANYGDYSIFNRIYNYYTNSVFSTISPQESHLTYSYSVSSRRFHSDAEKVYLDSNGNYIHVWNINPDNPSRNIYFYTISANRGIWLLSAIIIGIIFAFILLSIALIKHLKNKKKNNYNNSENNKI